MVFRGFPLDHSEIVEVAQSYGLDCLRDGTHKMFHELNSLDVPILVFSAGLGDSVVAILEETNTKLPNVKVISCQEIYIHTIPKTIITYVVGGIKFSSL